MPETPPPATPAHSGHPRSVAAADGANTDLPRLLASAVLGIDGVVRLEPSMKDLLLKADPTRLRRTPGPRAHDGVSISTFGTITDVTIDAAIAAPRQALTTAREVQQTVDALLRVHSMEPGRVEVNILAIEYEETNDAGRGSRSD